MDCLLCVVLGEVLSDLFISDSLIWICEYDVIPTDLILKHCELACNSIDVNSKQLLDILVFVAEVHDIFTSGREYVVLRCF